MLVSERQSVIFGNTVLAPQFEPAKKKNDKYDELKKQKEEFNKNQKQKKVAGKLSVIKTIATVFVIGLLIVSRYAMIYSNQNKLSSVKSQERTLRAENEELKLNLVKLDNLSNIENIAVNQLHMVRVNKNSAIYINLSKNNLIATTSEENNLQTSFIDYIKKILF